MTYDNGRHGVDLSNGFEAVPVFLEECSAQLSLTFQYSPENIQGPGCTIDPSEVTLPGCLCLSHTCSSESCTCLQTHGQAYDNDTNTLLQLSTTTTHSGHFCLPVFECNTLCACGDTCPNRVVQRGLRLSLEVYMTDNRGWGVRTLDAILRGTFVCEYAGEVISFKEARRRQLAQTHEDNNYIIAVREHSGPDCISETFVDPAMVGNVGRFLNHSCAPNLWMQPVRVHSAVPSLALFAGRDIDAQEELTFDYSGGYGNWPPPPPELMCAVSTQKSENDAFKDSRTDGLQRKECHCGADHCVRVLPLDLSIIS